MIRVKPLILEMDFVNDNDNGKEEEEPNNVDSRRIRSDCIKKGSLYRTKIDTKEKGIHKIAYSCGCKSKKIISLFSNN
jgi:hypothetical protein